MRFMVIVKASPESEAGVLPDEKALTEMGRFNEELIKAGVLADAFDRRIVTLLAFGPAANTAAASQPV